MMVGRPTFGVERPADAATASGAPILRISDLDANGAHGLPALSASRSTSPAARSWGRRRLGQRADRARRGAVGHARTDRWIDRR